MCCKLLQFLHMQSIFQDEAFQFSYMERLVTFKGVAALLNCLNVILNPQSPFGSTSLLINYLVSGQLQSRQCQVSDDSINATLKHLHLCL